MAGQYIGIGGVARKVKNQYFGVANVARKVKSGFIGVGGVARKFYSAIVSPLAIMTDGTPDSSKGMWSASDIISNNDASDDGTTATTSNITQLTGRMFFMWSVKREDWYGRITRLSDAIDLDGYSKVRISCYYTIEEENYAIFAISTSAYDPLTYSNGSAQYATYNAQKKFTAGETTSATTYDIDVSSINGKAYLYLDQNSVGWGDSSDYGHYDNKFNLVSITLIE